MVLLNFNSMVDSDKSIQDFGLLVVLMRVLVRLYEYKYGVQPSTSTIINLVLVCLDRD